MDKGANRSIKPVGDLDPNGRMAWNWEVGYKFFLFEGVMDLGKTFLPLVYHVGFDENYKTLAFDLDQSGDLVDLKSAYFTVDIMRLFKGTSTIDMAEFSTVKFDKRDAQAIAGNFVTMISLN